MIKSMRPFSLVLISYLIIFFGFQTSIHAEEIAGHVKFLRGVVSAQNESGEVRILADESPLFQGDTITTAKKSFAVLVFIDDSKLSLRPDTVFAVNTFNTQENNESAVMELVRGGLRLVTGFISKKGPDNYKINTTVATIGIRGTELDARFCETDCQVEAEKLPDLAQASYLVVGRVAFVKGALRAIRQDGLSHILTKGGPLYQGDHLVTGDNSYAVLAFRDEGRITLKANTEFHIEQLEFNPETPDEGHAFFRLVKGGMRALTGLLGHDDSEDYQVATPVATIGIRGTGFDLQCKGTCINESASASNSQQPPIISSLLQALIPDASAEVPADGMFISVWEGEIAVIRSAGIFRLGQGKAIFVENQRSPVIELPVIPDFIRQAPEPRPDQVDVDHDALFQSVRLEGWPPGLYVSVYDGHVRLVQIATGLTLDLGGNEAGFVGTEDDRFMRIESIPYFEQIDRYFRLIDESSIPIYSLLNDNTLDTGFQCVIQ